MMPSPTQAHANSILLRLSILTLFVGGVSVGCSPPSRPEPEATPAATNWYTHSRTLYYGIPTSVSFSPNDAQLAARVWEYLESVDHVFNDYRDDSEIGKLNTMTDRLQVPVSADLATALTHSFTVHQASYGAFDITVGPLRRLWRASEKSNTVPTDTDLLTAVRQCGLHHITLNPPETADQPATVTIANDKLKLDFGGIIKGIAVDRAIALLVEANVDAAMVQIGGEIAALGQSKRGAPHVLGIQHPAQADSLWTRIADTGAGISLSTSGNYRNPIRIGDQLFYHIFNPKTGEPVENHIMSVSIVIPKIGYNWLADGLSTAAAVLGPEKALAVVAQNGGEALFIVAEHGRLVEYKTSGWTQLERPLAR